MKINIKSLLFGILLGGILTTIIGIAGFMGHKNTDENNIPDNIKGIAWSQVAAGMNHNIAISADGRLWVWGYHSLGCLGLKDEITTYAPALLEGTSGTWKAIACGSNHTLAIDKHGALWAWGNNTDGQLGLGNMTNDPRIQIVEVNQPLTEYLAYSQAPVRVNDDEDWKSVACGGHYTSAIKSDGTLWAWGNNKYGQLGLGDTITRSSPTKIGTDTNWKTIACGWSRTLAIKSNGTLWAWGNNSAGQIGLGDTITITVPTQVGMDTNWKDIIVADKCAFAIKTDNTLWTWGDNKDGQLGLGDTIARTIPTQVGKDANWKTIACGRYDKNVHVIAIKTDNTLWAWGANDSGQLGFGDTINRTTPTQVGTGTNWKTVACGCGYTMAIKADGMLWAWGDNIWGKLGLGETPRTTPTQVIQR